MSILQSACIALAAVISLVAYLGLSVKVSDFVYERSGSMDLGAAAFLVMIATPVITAIIFISNQGGVWP